jgi:hypothetical protein
VIFNPGRNRDTGGLNRRQVYLFSDRHQAQGTQQNRETVILPGKRIGARYANLIGVVRELPRL